MLRKIVRILVFGVALGILFFGLKNTDLARQLKTKFESSVSTPSFSVPKTEIEESDWTEDQLLGRLNKKREALGLKVLSVNTQLTQAAKARLAVLLNYDDFLGEETGLTRERATIATGYEYAWIGDLVLTNFFKSNDPIEYWLEIENASKTISEKNFTEVGLAIHQDKERVSAYILLASKRKTAAQLPNTKVSWGGPELWKEINKKRVESGVNSLTQKDELCTIAAIRLNQILEKNALDNHEGFNPTLARKDLEWISQKYNISEFLVSGYKTAEESVMAWMNTLGHKKLITGGEYVWGCVYAQNGFGVAIAAY